MPLTGAAARTRGSAAAIQKVAAPPPLIPVTPDTIRIHVGSRLQIVDRANTVPTLDPPPVCIHDFATTNALSIGTMMLCSDLAQLQRVQNPTNVSMLGKPDGMRLISGLVPHSAPCSNARKDRESPAASRLRQSRLADKDCLSHTALDDSESEDSRRRSPRLHRSCHCGLQRRLRYIRINSQHIEVLASPFRYW